MTSIAEHLKILAEEENDWTMRMLHDEDQRSTHQTVRDLLLNAAETIEWQE